MTKHLVCDSRYRLQMVKDKVVDNKVVFSKMKTTLVVDYKRGSFVIDNSLSPVCEQVIDHFSLFRSDACSMSLVVVIFLPMRITSKFQDSLRTYRLSATEQFVSETHFLAQILVDQLSCRLKIVV